MTGQRVWRQKLKDELCRERDIGYYENNFIHVKQILVGFKRGLRHCGNQKRNPKGEQGKAIVQSWL